MTFKTFKTFETAHVLFFSGIANTATAVCGAGATCFEKSLDIHHLGHMPPVLGFHMYVSCTCGAAVSPSITCTHAHMHKDSGLESLFRLVNNSNIFKT